MKLINIAIICLLIGCNNNTETPIMTKTDSLLVVSDSIIKKAEYSGKILDSVTTVTAEKVADNVDKLNETITNYQTRIKSAVKTMTVERVIHDTVYIETKKNFWGKTKKSVTTKSDSTVDQLEIIDTLQ